jgi:hypothetical protein
MTENPRLDDAAEALRLVQTERQRLATTLRTEAHWYAPVYGALVGIMVLVFSNPWRWIGWGAAFVTLSFVALMYAYQRTTGVWFRTSGPDVPRAPMIAVAVLMIGGLGVAVLARHVWHLGWIAVIAAVVTGTGAALLSRASDRAYARNLSRA